MTSKGSTASPTGRASAPKAYKHATPALNDKLQRYKEDPEALAELQKRVKQHKAASRPGSAGSNKDAPIDTLGSQPSLSRRTTFEHRSPRNFIEENAAVVTPWPCTGPLSSKAIAAAQQSSGTTHDDSDSSADTYSIPTSGASSSAVTPRPGSAADKRQQPAALSPGQLYSSSNPFAQPQLQERPLSPVQAQQRPASPHASFTVPFTAASVSSISTMHSASSRPQSAGSSLGRANSNRGSMSRSLSQTQPDVEGTTTPYLEQLGAQMAAKKEAAAARAAGAAERRAALAEAEQQRRLELSTRAERLEAERLAALQAGAAATARLEQQELWSGVVVAVAATADLAVQLELRRKQGAAAAVIAEGYKRYLNRKRYKEFMQLIIRVRKAIKPNLPRLLEAAHKRCADRILLFLQRNSNSSMVLFAAQRFRHSVSLIQSHWRRTRLVRMAQEHLLATAMKRQEQQIAARNASAAAQAALAEEMDANMQNHGRFRAGRSNRTPSGSGHRGPSGNGSLGSSGTHSANGHLSGSGSRRSNGQVHIDSAANGTDVRPRSGSDRSISGSGQRQQQPPAAEPIVPFVRHGNTLFMPDEFFMDESSPGDSGDSASSNISTGAQRPTAASRSSSRDPSSPSSPELTAAVPHGPISPRGGYMTGQLTAMPGRPARSASTRQRDLPQLAVPSSNQQQGTMVSPTSPSRGLLGNSDFRNRTAGNGALSSRSRANGNGSSSTNRPASAGAAGGSVGWHADVVDLEVEARLKDLLVPLPNNIRKQVVRSHLKGVRRALIAEREAYAISMKHYHKKLELEKLKQQLLKEAGVDAPITLQPPKAPRMRVLVPRDKLKLMIVEGMDVLQQEIIAARLARDDAAGTAAEDLKLAE